MVLKSFVTVKSFMVNLLNGNRKGQGMVEYALIIALVAILLVAGIGLMKDQIVAVFTSITNTLQGATAG